MLVRQGDDGKTVLSYHPIGPVLREAGIAEPAPTRLESAQKTVLREYSIPLGPQARIPTSMDTRCARASEIRAGRTAPRVLAFWDAGQMEFCGAQAW
jgi:hypothetical protein